MTYQPYAIYIVAWDWILWALYVLIGALSAVALAGLLAVEFSDRRNTRGGELPAETNQPKEQ